MLPRHFSSSVAPPEYVHPVSSICPLVVGRLGCLHVLAAGNVQVRVSFWIRVLSRYLPRRGIDGDENSLPIISLRSFMVSYLMFKSSDHHPEFIFMYGNRMCPNFNSHVTF